MRKENNAGAPVGEAKILLGEAIRKVFGTDGSDRKRLFIRNVPANFSPPHLSIVVRLNVLAVFPFVDLQKRTQSKRIAPDGKGNLG